jgi:hypothetical protein
MVIDVELEEIQQQISRKQSQHKDWNPEFGYILINKRVNARFMLKGDRGQKDFDNPKAGTVIDSVVTLPER